MTGVKHTNNTVDVSKQRLLKATASLASYPEDTCSSALHSDSERSWGGRERKGERRRQWVTAGRAAGLGTKNCHLPA